MEAKSKVISVKFDRVRLPDHAGWLAQRLDEARVTKEESGSGRVAWQLNYLVGGKASSIMMEHHLKRMLTGRL
jgi:hypothetical protein